MNRRNLLAAIAAAVTGVLWRKKPEPPKPDYRPELLAGLFELCHSVMKEYHQIGIALDGIWGLDGKFKPPTAVSKEEREALQIELVKSEGKREVRAHIEAIMCDVIPDYGKQLDRFSGISEEMIRRADLRRKQRGERMRRDSPDSFKEGGCFFVTPQQHAEAKAYLRKMDQERLSNRRRLQVLAKEKGLPA